MEKEVTVDSPQLSLKLNVFDPNHSWDSFYCGPNSEAVKSLKQLVFQSTEGFVYLCGPGQVGKTHLLQLAINTAIQNNQMAMYLSLKQAKQYQPTILENLDQFSLVAIDDIDSVAGDYEWNRALFNLYNTLLANNRRLVITSSVSPKDLELKLPDLKSRLLSNLVYSLRALSDHDLVAVLKIKGNQVGLELSDEVIAFMLKRVKRDMGSISELFAKLNSASMSEQRRITVPFIKQTLAL